MSFFKTKKPIDVHKSMLAAGEICKETYAYLDSESQELINSLNEIIKSIEKSRTQHQSKEEISDTSASIEFAGFRKHYCALANSWLNKVSSFDAPKVKQLLDDMDEQIKKIQFAPTHTDFHEKMIKEIAADLIFILKRSVLEFKNGMISKAAEDFNEIQIKSMGGKCTLL